MDVSGTAFQQAVWAALRAIPPGETRTYGQIAAAIGRPGAVRAAGTACGGNNLAVLIPCHRVLRSDGSLGGYASGTQRKRALLEREKRGGTAAFLLFFPTAVGGVLPPRARKGVPYGKWVFVSVCLV